MLKIRNRRESSEGNTKDENWDNCVKDSSKAIGAGIFLGTVGAYFAASGLPIIIGAGVGIVVAGASCIYDLTRPTAPPFRTRSEQACDEELHNRSQRYVDLTEEQQRRQREQKQKVWEKYGCKDLPIIEDRFDNCMTVKQEEIDREWERTKPCNPCDHEKKKRDPDEECEADKNLTEEEAEEKKNMMKKKLDDDLAEKLNKFKQYQYIRPLKRFTSPRKKEIWDNYVSEDDLHLFKSYPMKRFTKPKYIDEDEE